jgi:hypothetical protein
MSTTPNRPTEPAPIRFMTLRDLRRENAEGPSRAPVRRPPRIVLRTVPA